MTHNLARVLAPLALLLATNVFADNGIYVELQLGYVDVDTGLSIQEGVVDLLFKPEDSGPLLAGVVGYRFDERWFVNLGYQSIDMDDTEVVNIVASANYRFWQQPDGWSAFAGILGGTSELEWQDDPVITRFRERKSEQDFFGGQLGLEWAFRQQWQFTLTYQYLDLEHTTKLDTGFGRGEFTHDAFQQLLGGLRYHF